MSARHRITVYEGLSGAGKSTLIDQLRVVRGNQDLQVHRFTAGMWVYSQVYGRTFDLVELREVEKAMQAVTPTLVVWCRVPPEVAYERCLAKGDKLFEKGNFAKADALYERYLLGGVTAAANVLVVDTYLHDVDTCAELIARRVEEL